MVLFKFVLNSIPRPWLIKASYWVAPIVAFTLKGKRYTDPIDGRSFRKFLPYGYENQRENVLAPGSLSLERHRLMWLYLKNNTSLFQQTVKVLHVAPEQCFYKRFKNLKNWEYLCTDLHSPLADIKADLCALPFKDNSYDVVFCNHVLEHVENDAKALKELHRVLKPGGLGIFQVPQDLQRATTYEDASIRTAAERKKHFGQYDHVRVYGQDYFDRLRKAGFEVTPLKCTELVSEEKIETYRLSSTEILPICRKS